MQAKNTHFPLRMTFSISIGMSFFLILFMNSCTKEVYTPNFCFQEDVLPIFVSNCANTGCHNSIDKAEELDLSNYNGIMEEIVPGHPNQSEIYQVIKGKNPEMPPEDHLKLTAEQVNIIKKWIKVGAPNSSNCNTCDTLDYTFSGRIQPLLNNWCVGCHNSSTADGGIILTNYSSVMIAVNNNSFLGSIKHLSGFTAMPKNAGSLSSCEINAIEKWINNGALNN
jgi:hypothetical protein